MCSLQGRVGKAPLDNKTPGPPISFEQLNIIITYFYPPKTVCLRLQRLSSRAVLHCCTSVFLKIHSHFPWTPKPKQTLNITSVIWNWKLKVNPPCTPPKPLLFLYEFTWFNLKSLSCKACFSKLLPILRISFDFVTDLTFKITRGTKKSDINNKILKQTRSMTKA